MRTVFTAEDAADTQALLKTGFDDLYCCYLLLRVGDAGLARAWLRGQKITRLSEVGGGNRLHHARQVALTAAGLRKLGIGEALMSQFAPEFAVGLADDPSRSRRLGDVGADDPARWAWGSGANEPHVMLMVFDESAGIRALADELRTDALASGFSACTILDSGDMEDREPFGFRDGISQPAIDWKAERTPGSDADMDFHNLIATGEFLLGYPNEYGLYTERPLLGPEVLGATSLPRAPDEPALHDLGRNGTYLVFRQLHQHVPRFWQWVQREAGGGEEAAIALAEAMVGRHIKGEPFAGLGRQDIPGIVNKPDRPRNDFTYARDRAGQVCPIGSHIRRANPRTGDYPTGRTGLIKKLLTLFGLTGTAEDDRIASARFHRILRRGREYGEEQKPHDAMRPGAPELPSGLHFVCLNANLARQFEFVQGAWMASAKFAGMSGEQDPLLGNRVPFPGTQATDRFTRPSGDGPCRVHAGLPQFVTVVGGAYFFLPGIKALAWLLADR
jgi:deferrochelatase/peroxidase EfeB